MIWYALGEAVEWVECVARVRRRHDPPVMRFVQCFVHSWMMQCPMDPIDEEICEHDEEGELKSVVQGEGSFGWGVVELCVSAHFSEEEHDGENGHDGKRGQSLLDL